MREKIINKQKMCITVDNSVDKKIKALFLAI